MQISDMLIKYGQNATSSVATREQTAKTGTQQVTGTLAELTEGSVFEGTVKSVKNGQVTLVLANGESVTARLDAKINLQLQQSMFFEVKSNTATQIAIKPYVNANGGNPTLLQALMEAGIQPTSENIELVRNMMEEQMPIDRQSLNNMVRQLSAFPGTDSSALVLMNKLGIPVNEANIQQFLNYRQDASSILGELDGVLEQLGTGLVSEDMSAGEMVKQNGEMLDILLPNTENFTEQAAGAEQAADETTILQNAEEAENPAIQNEQEGEQQIRQAAERERQTAGNALNAEETGSLKQQVEKLGIGEESGLFDQSGQIKGKPEEFLGRLQKALEQLEQPSKEDLEQLLSGKELRKLFKEAVQKEWFLQPEQIGKENTVKELYGKLQEQMNRLEQFAQNHNLEHTGLKQAVSEVRSNIEFMNEINQMYNFVQIPLKMHAKNVNSELYVYSNKRNLRDPEGELSAFLHLDMDFLGSTDISVKMKGTDVKTEFYMEDDASYELVLSHAEELAKKLEDKGYHCSIEVQNEGRKMDFVEDFLKQDLPASGRLHRYSFDMRA